MATIMHNSGSYPSISVDGIRSTRSTDLFCSTTNGRVSYEPVAQATADEEPHYSIHSRMRIDDYIRHFSNGQYRDTTLEEIRMTGTRYYKHPDYESKDNRKDSFTYSEWCKQEDSVDPAGLVEAGFYYTGHGTRVNCFSCGLGLSHIKPDDNLWEEHALRTEECSFLVEQKGETFIQEIKDRLLPDRFPNGRVPYFTRDRRHHRHAGWAEVELADLTEQSTSDSLSDVDDHVENNTRADLLLTDDRENADDEAIRSRCTISLEKKDVAMPYKIFYFNCRGRAQPIRYLLLDNNQEYEEVDIPASEKWITDYKPQMPFGQAPMLKDGDHEVAQTTAILRYVGRKCGAHPSDAKDASRADMITEVAHEMRNAYGTMCWTTYDTDTGKADHVKIANEKFQFVENLMKTWGNDFILDKICFADYYLFDVLDCHEVLSPGFLDQFPTLKAFFARMAARPAIKKFRESEVNTKRFVNGNGKQ